MQKELLNIIHLLTEVYFCYSVENIEIYRACHDAKAALQNALPQFITQAEQDYRQNIDITPLTKRLIGALKDVAACDMQAVTLQDADGNEVTEIEGIPIAYVPMALTMEVRKWLQYIREYYPLYMEAYECEPADTSTPAEASQRADTSTPTKREPKREPKTKLKTELKPNHKLNTPNAMAAFDAVSKAGYIERDGTMWKWLGTAASYGYFVAELSKRLKIMLNGSRIPWRYFKDVIINADKITRAAMTSQARKFCDDDTDDCNAIRTALDNAGI